MTGSPAAQILSLLEAVSLELAGANGGVLRRIAIRSRSGLLRPDRHRHRRQRWQRQLRMMTILTLTASTMMTMITMMARKPHGGKACQRPNHHAANLAPHYRRAKRPRFENPNAVTATRAAAANGGRIPEAVVRNHRLRLDHVSLGAAAADWVARLRLPVCTIPIIKVQLIILIMTRMIMGVDIHVHRQRPEQFCDARIA